MDAPIYINVTHKCTLICCGSTGNEITCPLMVYNCSGWSITDDGTNSNDSYDSETLEL